MTSLACDFFPAQNKHEADSFCFEGFSSDSDIKSVTIANYTNSAEFSFSLKAAKDIRSQETLKSRIKALLAHEGFTEVIIKDYGTDEFSVTVPLEATWQTTRVAHALSHDCDQGGGKSIFKVLSQDDVVALHRSHFKAYADLLKQKVENDQTITLNTKVSSITLDEIFKHNPRKGGEGSPRYFDAHLGDSMTGMILFIEEHGSRFVPETETLIRFIDEPSAQAAAELMGLARQREAHSGTLIRVNGRLGGALDALATAGILPPVAVDHVKQQQATVAAQFATPAPAASKPQAGASHTL